MFCVYLQVVRKFREGGYNTLVATCVGEEGLDIGEVDLIVCFDAHKSPIRLVQRMGRTGRKRAGRIVVIVAQGKEEQVSEVHSFLFLVSHFIFSTDLPQESVKQEQYPQGHQGQLSFPSFLSSCPSYGPPSHHATVPQGAHER